MQDLAALVDRLGCPRLLVVGDVILDRYTHGDAERVSPEAPVPVLRADECEVRPGGAASVAAMLRALGAEVRLAGIVGDDPEGRILARLLHEAGVEAAAVLCDPDRPTTAKDRFLGRAAGRHPQQILRVDRESRTPLPPELESRLAEVLPSQAEGCQAVLVSDYGKGVCTPGLLAAVLAASRDLPVLIDPTRTSDYSRYRGQNSSNPIAPRRSWFAAGRSLRRRRRWRRVGRCAAAGASAPCW
jgi:D-beta-D-heptose 7-phosphate kinase / D-beta-D-heptose 1-phosphate adenosyltransferase